MHINLTQYSVLLTRLYGCVADSSVARGCYSPPIILSTKMQNKKNNTFLAFFNRFACFWPKGYQLGSLGKSHQNGDYLKQAMRKIVFPQESNLQPLDYRSTALPLELEKTPPRMLNFGYLNPATCLLYDCDNKSIKMFFDVFRPELFDSCGQSCFSGQSCSIPVGRQFFALLVLSSRRSGGSSLGFRAGSL